MVQYAAGGQGLTNYAWDVRITFPWNLSYTAAVKTSISIPDPLFQEAELVAKRLRISRSQLYARALEYYLPRQRPKGIKRALDAVYSTEPSELDPVIVQLQAMALYKEKW
jgi:metal-responsive CopG/Arc/MetJ family transcriptional regulator